MNIDKVRDLLNLLAKAPNSQIDITIAKRLAILVHKDDLKDIEKELEKILDECARYTLASDFAVVSLDMALKYVRENITV